MSYKNINANSYFMVTRITTILLQKVLDAFRNSIGLQLIRYGLWGDSIRVLFWSNPSIFIWQYRQFPSSLVKMAASPRETLYECIRGRGCQSHLLSVASNRHLKIGGLCFSWARRRLMQPIIFVRIQLPSVKVSCLLRFSSSPMWCLTALIHPRRPSRIH